jgi:hypothetical protein
MLFTIQDRRLGLDGLSDYFWCFYSLSERRFALQFKASALAM